MEPKDTKRTPGPMQGARWVMNYRREFSASEMRTFGRASWVSDQGARYVVWNDMGVIRVWDTHLDACLYELPVYETDDGKGLVTVADVLDDVEKYRRCEDDRAEADRLDRILSSILTCRTT